MCLFVCLSVFLSDDLFVCMAVFLSVCLSFCLSVCLSICLSVYLSVYLYVCLSVCLSICLSFCLSFCLSICLSFCLSFCLSICLSVYQLISLLISVGFKFLLVLEKGSDFDLVFQSKSTANYAEYASTLSLTELTTCAWGKLSSSATGYSYFFSFATRSKNEGIVLGYHVGDKRIITNILSTGWK